MMIMMVMVMVMMMVMMVMVMVMIRRILMKSTAPGWRAHHPHCLRQGTVSQVVTVTVFWAWNGG